MPSNVSGTGSPQIVMQMHGQNGGVARITDTNGDGIFSTIANNELAGDQIDFFADENCTIKGSPPPGSPFNAANGYELVVTNPLNEFERPIGEKAYALRVPNTQCNNSTDEITGVTILSSPSTFGQPGSGFSTRLLNWKEPKKN